jgi:Glucose dehydrogenase C-terminus
LCKPLAKARNPSFRRKGAQFEALAEATIRSVTTGILGVALIQTLFAGLGFLVVRLPGAGLWTLLFLIAAVLQVGALVLIPAVIYVSIREVATGGIICLTGIGSGDRRTGATTGDIAAEVVLRNNVVVGSVNANKRHWYKALAKHWPGLTVHGWIG